MKSNTLLYIIGIETIALFVMGAVLIKNSAFYRNQSTVLAESTTGQEIDLSSDIQSCLQLPASERPICAKMIGMKLTVQTISNDVKIRNCMKLRPVYYRYCLEALQSNQ